MKGIFRKIDDRTIVAVDIEAMEALANVHRGENCIGDIRGARNVEQFHLFWSLVDLVAKATDTPKYGVSDWLKEQTNLADIIFYPTGEMKLKPRSIAFESLPQAEFAAFFNAAVPKIAEQLGAAPADIIKRFEDLLNPDSRAHFRKIMKGQGYA